MSAHLLLDFLKFENDELILLIAAAMQVGQNLECFRFPVFVHEPTRRLGEEQHARRKDDGRNHLETPRNSERRDTLDVRAAELDKVLDQDTPCDRPLLKRDHAPTDGGCGDFGLVDGDDGGCETNGDTRDDTADNEHAAVLG